MDPELQKLIRQLQDHKCPPAVMERVAERIARDKASRPSPRLSLAWALSTAILLSALALWTWQTRRHAQLFAAEQAAAQARADRALVLQQTHQAFGYISHAFMRAA